MLSTTDFQYQTNEYSSFIPPAIFSPYVQKPNLTPQQMLAGTALTSQSSASSNVRFATTDCDIASDFFSGISFGNTAAFKNEQFKQSIAISKISAFWKKFLLDPIAPNDVDAISVTVEYIFEAISQFGPGAIDLNKLAEDRVSGEHLAAILRATSTWKSLIPGWKAALHVAEIALVRVGIDPQDALVGLS